jgi:hypothetical protein
MKYPSALNGEGRNMEQVYIFKADDAEDIVPVTLRKEAHDGKDIHVIFTNKHLTGPEVTGHIFDNHLMRLINETRRGPDDQEDLAFEEPVVITLDGDNSNLVVLKEREEKINQQNTRIGLFSASQTGNEQDKDASKEFKEFPQKLNSTAAEHYLNQHGDQFQRFKREIKKQSGLRFTAGHLDLIATGLVKAQYAHCLTATSAANCQALRVTGHWPYDPEQIFLRHPGMAAVPMADRTRYLSLVRDEFLPLFTKQGHFKEKDFDERVIPETDEQKAARAKGHKVKVLQRLLLHNTTYVNIMCVYM